MRHGEKSFCEKPDRFSGERRFAAASVRSMDDDVVPLNYNVILFQSDDKQYSYSICPGLPSITPFGFKVYFDLFPS